MAETPALSDLLAALDYGPAPDDAGPALAWLAARPDGIGPFLGGDFAAPGEGPALHAPGGGAMLARIGAAGAGEIAAAVAAARGARAGWGALGPAGRAACLRAFARELQAQGRRLALLHALETGRPLALVHGGDLPLALRWLTHHAGRAAGLAAPAPRVLAAPVPAQTALLDMVRLAAPALAAGDVVIVKPSLAAPLAALALGQIAAAAGLPPGVLNVLPGDAAAGAALVAAPGVEGVAFAGAPACARKVAQALAGQGRALRLSLRGKAALIVLDSADLDAVVEAVVETGFLARARLAPAGLRVLVAESVAERLEAQLRRRLGTLRSGDPLEKSVDLGPLARPGAAAALRAALAQARAEGLVVHEGTAPAAEGFAAPAVVCGVAPASPLWSADLRGPLVTLTPFRTPQDALALVASGADPLEVAIWGQDIDAALGLADRIGAASVRINCTEADDPAATLPGAPEPLFSPGADPAPAPASDPAPKPAPAEGEGDTRARRLLIGGRQVRAESGLAWAAPGGGQAPLGARKDIRNAVEAARAAEGWSRLGGSARAQALHLLAETVAAQQAMLAQGLRAAGAAPAQAQAEVAAACAAAMDAAAAADRGAGQIAQTGAQHLALLRRRPLGVIGIVCPPAAPLLGFLARVLPAIAAGNRVVAIPSEAAPLPALDLAALLGGPDLPPGVLNVVSGPRDALAPVLAGHEEVRGLWYSGPARAQVEAAAAHNLTPVWSDAAEGADLAAQALHTQTLWLTWAL